MFILLQRISRRRAGFPQILLQEDFRHSPSTFAPLHARQYRGTCPRGNPQPNDADRSAGKVVARHCQKGTPERFTIVGLWGRYILKPQTEHYPHLPELEDLTMHMAEAVKMQVVPHSLVRFADGELCYITRRIDRGPHGEKYPMEDLCQLSERLTEHKYKGSYEQIAKTILRYSSAPKLDAVNFWEQVLFSWLTGNADMHLKNFSLYSLNPGVYGLTPAYDLLSTALVLPEDTEELALTLNGRKRKLRRSDFVQAMTASGMDEKVIDNLFKKFIKAIPKWGEWIDVSFLPEEMKGKYKALIAERIKQLT